MTAIVLAAGYATRLFPFTRGFPKALLKTFLPAKMKQVRLI